MKKTYKQCYAWGLDVLMKAGVADARIDARFLLEYICHTTQHDLILHGDRLVTDKEQAAYEAFILQRARRIPLQHIIGRQAFMGFDFQVNSHVLIPRQDTEVLVETALDFVKPGMSILDMCTGSGCILLSLLALAGERTESLRGIGVDISTEALQVAAENLERISAQCGRRPAAEFVQSDLFNGLADKGLCFDMIVSNPPYIASKVIETLEPEVRLHEPMGALDGRADGLFFYRHIVAECKPFLKKGGALLFEIGHDQGTAVSDLMKEAGFTGIIVKRDYAGLDRIVYGFFEEEVSCLTD